MTTADLQVISIDLGADDAEPVLSHIVKLGSLEVRVLADPHQWNLLKTSTDPTFIIRAYVHPDDWLAIDNYLSNRRGLPTDAFVKLANALVEKPTGHPTLDSSGFSDT